MTTASRTPAAAPTTEAAPTEATSEAPKATATSTAKSEAEVRYVGVASRRILTEEDWKNVGAPGQKGVEWNFQNKFRLPKSDFSDKALAYLKKDNGFKITG